MKKMMIILVVKKYVYRASALTRKLKWNRLIIIGIDLAGLEGFKEIIERENGTLDLELTTELLRKGLSVSTLDNLYNTMNVG